MLKEVKLFALFIMVYWLISTVSAQYISGDIYLEDNGKVRFYVNTNVNPNIPGLKFENNRLTGTTETLIDMQNGIWTFELNEGNYKTILVNIHLPLNIKTIDSINGVDNILDLNGKVVDLIDDDKELIFKISYKINSGSNYSWIFYIVILFLILLSIYFYFKFKRKKNEKFDYILPIVNDAEKKIINLLMKKPMKQKEIRKTLDIPKASFSRYMFNLERKKLLIREGEGKNKLVRLK